MEDVWDILDTWWWSLSPIILSFDVFVEFLNARLCMKSISCTNLGPLREWYSTRYEQYFCQSLGPTEAILWPPRWLDSPGGWGGAALEVFDRPLLWRLGSGTVSGDSLGHLSSGGVFFLFETSTVKGLKFSYFWRCWVCWYLRTSSLKSIC